MRKNKRKLKKPSKKKPFQHEFKESNENIEASREEETVFSQKEKQRKKKPNYDKKDESAATDLRNKIQELTKENSSLEKEVEEQKKKHLYLSADMDNLRKQLIKDKEEALRFSKKSMVLEFLKTLDILQQALSLKVDENNWKNFHQGVCMTEGELKKAFLSFGLEEINVNVGDSFEPAFHEAIGLESSEEVPKGQIMRVFCKPYKMYGKIIRSAKVIVSKGSDKAKDKFEQEAKEDNNLNSDNTQVENTDEQE